MSEQTNAITAHAVGFMAELDSWCEATIIEPLLDNQDEILLVPTIDGVKRAIRAKVLESYRNGQAAGPSKVQRVFRPRR